MDTYGGHRPDPRIAARDAGLRRVYRLTRWVGVGAVGAVGLLAAYVAQAKPGYSTDPSPATGAVGGAGARAVSQAVPPAAALPQLSTGGGSESLTPPPAAPAPVVTPPPVTPAPVVSGGS